MESKEGIASVCMCTCMCDRKRCVFSENVVEKMNYARIERKNAANDTRKTDVAMYTYICYTCTHTDTFASC